MNPFPTILVKYCKTEHNPLKGAQAIQLGTIDYYRRFDPTFMIGDEAEAEYTLEVQPEGGVKFDAELSERLFGSGLSFTGEVQMPQGARMSARWQFPNAFVFSCCIADGGAPPSPEVARAICGEYDSYYIIDDDQFFARLIMDRLAKETRSSALSTKALSLLNQCVVAANPRLNVTAIGRPVEYVDSKDIRIAINELHDVPHHKDLLLRSLFMKHARYREQREFRFIWSIESDIHGVLSVREAPLLITLNQFADTLKYNVPTGDTGSEPSNRGVRDQCSLPTAGSLSAPSLGEP